MSLWNDLRRLVGGKPVLGGDPRTAESAQTDPRGTARADGAAADNRRKATNVDAATATDGSDCCGAESCGTDSCETNSSGTASSGCGCQGTAAPLPPVSAGTDGPPAIQVLLQAPLTDLKRTSRYLASVGIESQLLMPPGGCGT